MRELKHTEVRLSATEQSYGGQETHPRLQWAHRPHLKDANKLIQGTRCHCNHGGNTKGTEEMSSDHSFIKHVLSTYSVPKELGLNGEQD